MRGLVLAQSINKPGFKDATGVFLPGAKYFAQKYMLAKPVLLDDVDDRNKMIGAIEKAQMLDVIAYFGHADRNRLGSADIGMGDLDRLVKAIRKAANPGCQVILYACQAGGTHGFAEKIADRVGNIVVWGHSCSGHGNTNPYVTRHPYAPDTSPFLVDPAGPLFHGWTKLIKSNSDIWARYPFMPKASVEREIRITYDNMAPLERMFGKEPKGGEFNPNDPLFRMFGVSPGSR